MFAATCFAYPSAIQTRLNSTNEGANERTNKISVRYIESVKPEKPEQGRRAQYVSEGPVPKCSLYVGNLFFDVTAEDLRSHFEQYGTVENVMIVHDARGLSKG
jgi:RNA recognition motif-containing protein